MSRSKHRPAKADHARRRFRPHLERLEDRWAPAVGVFSENFSSDFDPALPGFDTFDTDPATPQPDAAIVQNDLPGSGAISGPLPGGSFSLQPGRPGDVGWGLLADGQVLHLASFGPTVQVTFSMPPAGSPGGLAPDEAVTGIGLSVLGLGFVQAFGANGILQMEFNTHTVWQRLVADRDDLLPNGLELGPISRLVVYTHHEGRMWLDEVIAQVESADANIPPAANHDLVIVDRRYGESEVFFPLHNDFDANGDDFELLTHTEPALGTLDELFGGYRYRVSTELLADPAIREDSFQYTIRDTQGASSTGLVRIAFNAPPHGLADDYLLPHGASGSVHIAAGQGVLVNDSDFDGDPLTIALMTPPQHGEVTLLPTGEFTYVPSHPDGLVRNDFFTYRLSDGVSPPEFAAVSLRVENMPPFAPSEQFDFAHNAHSPVRERLSASDADGDPLRSVTLVAGPAHGTVSLSIAGGQAWFEYAADLGVLRGPDSFTYRVGDDHELSNIARVEIAVPNATPASNDHWPAVLYLDDPFIDIDLSGSAWDSDGDPITVRVFRDGQYGDATILPDGRVRYTPHSPGAVFGFDSVRFVVSDGVATSDPATISIEQRWRGIARSDAYSVREDESIDVDEAIDGLLQNDGMQGRFVSASFGQALGVATGVDVLPGEESTYVTGCHVSIHQPCPIASDGTFEFYGGITNPTGTWDLGLFRSTVMRFDYQFHYPEYPGAGTTNTSNRATVLVRVYPEDEEHSDDDGVSDAVEDAAPNDGDLNANSIPDRREFGWTSLPNAVDGRWVGLETTPGIKLFSVSAGDPCEQIAANIPPAPNCADFPLGIFHVALTGLGPGEAAAVTLHLPDGVGADHYYRLGGPPVYSDYVWYDFLYDGTTGAQFFDDDNDGYQDRVVLHYVDGGRGDDDGEANGVIVDPGGPVFRAAARVESVVLNDGHAQRSMINRLVVAFSGEVTLDPGALELRSQPVGKHHGAARRQDQGAARRQDHGAAVGLNVTTSLVNGQTVAVLTFRGSGIIGGSLADGSYRLTIHADRIRDASGRLLDGNADGTEGDDYRSEFFRLFGDSDGDGDVDRADQDRFKTTFHKRRGHSDYLWYFDFDADGRVDGCDSGQFHRRRAGPFPRDC